jgi:AcrR family transcriptional regulator
MVEPKQGHRRRGAELEDALLTAAWDELYEGGYGRFTMEAVAERAQTSTPVLYRRWPNRWELAVAAVRHHAGRNRVMVLNTGSLRTDLIAYLVEASKKRADIAVLFSLRMAEYFDDTASSMAELRENLLRGREGGHEIIYQRAVERGELKGELPPRLKTLPWDLLRHELMMTLRPLPRKAIVEMVDQIVLPLLTGQVHRQS